MTNPSLSPVPASRPWRFAFALVCLLAALACRPSSKPPSADAPARLEATPATPPAPTTNAPPPILLGQLQPEALRAVPGWQRAAAVDTAVAERLAHVPPGARVTVIVGTWCSDSRREVPRLLKALALTEQKPFELTFIGVGRDKQAPGIDLAPLDVRYVPTVIVSRDGRELGRIVESAPAGIEAELLALLTGDKTGVISGRPSSL